MRWDYARIDTDEDYAKAYRASRMKRWPKCRRVVDALRDMGYTQICTAPGYLEARNPNGVDIHCEFGHLSGYHRLLAPFLFNLHATEDPWQGPPKRPPPPSPPPVILDASAFNDVFPE